MKKSTVCYSLCIGLGLVLNVQAAVPGSGSTPKLHVQAPKAAEPHAHAEHGPHGGDLIELGKEEFHVEMFHDEKAGVLAFFILDSTAKKPIAIPAKEITVNVKANGRGKQYKIGPVPQQGDPQGSASCFPTKEKEFMDVMEKDGTEAVLVVEIGGKQYRGKIEHDHDHAHEKK